MRKIVQVEQNKIIVAPNAGELSIILIYKHASLVHLKNLNKGSLSRKKHFQIVKKEANTSRDLKQASIISPPILSNHRAFLCSNSICSQSIRKITQYRSYLTAKQDPSTMDLLKPPPDSDNTKQISLWSAITHICLNDNRRWHKKNACLSLSHSETSLGPWDRETPSASCLSALISPGRADRPQIAASEKARVQAIREWDITMPTDKFWN